MVMSLFFRVIQRFPDDSEERPFVSGKETKGLFSKWDRSVILRVVCEATRELLNWRRPALVDRCTADADFTS